jgi:acetylornithine deacetylase
MDAVLALARGLDAPACLATLAEMVRHKSYTATPGERALAERMVAIMREIGLEAWLQPVEGARVNAIGIWRGTGGGPSLMFNGHLDTNPATEGWTVDPWGGVVDDAFVYGIGVSNMKAGDAAAFCAVRALAASGMRLRGDVILTFVVGELQGGIGTLALIDSGLRADCFVNCEPTDLQALTMHAAAFTFVVELEGRTRHLSKREQAVDALLAACRLVPRLDALTFAGASGPEHRAINRVHVGTLQAGLGRALHGWRPAQVADFARLTGSARYAPGQTEAGALADLRRVLDALEVEMPGLRADLRIDEGADQARMPPFEIAPDAPIVQALNEAHATIRGTPQPTGAITPPGFYGTDASHLAAAGMQGAVCGPGGRYNTMPDERVDIPDYLDMIRIYMLTIARICHLDE